MSTAKDKNVNLTKTGFNERMLPHISDLFLIFEHFSRINFLIVHDLTDLLIEINIYIHRKTIH